MNLASQEYWGAVPAKTLKTPVVTCQFKEWRGDKLKIISFNAKRARGLMARYMIEQGVDQVDGLKDFAADDYAFRTFRRQNFCVYPRGLNERLRAVKAFYRPFLFFAA